MTDADGNRRRIPGLLAGCKAIGWYIDEYGFAQVSMNITDISVTPLHKAFTEVCRAAARRGRKVTGTEIIGLVPGRCLVEAGKYFSGDAAGRADEPELIKKAVDVMGLSSISPFDTGTRLI